MIKPILYSYYPNTYIYYKYHYLVFNSHIEDHRMINDQKTKKGQLKLKNILSVNKTELLFYIDQSFKVRDKYFEPLISQ